MDSREELLKQDPRLKQAIEEFEKRKADFEELVRMGLIPNKFIRTQAAQKGSE